MRSRLVCKHGMGSAVYPSRKANGMQPLHSRQIKRPFVKQHKNLRDLGLLLNSFPFLSSFIDSKFRPQVVRMMAIFDTTDLAAKALHASLAILTILLTAIVGRLFYMQKLHPLSKFQGPWYATSFSVVGAIISVLHKEPQFFMYLIEKYGSK
jgi:hypothetical protein